MTPQNQPKSNQTQPQDVSLPVAVMIGVAVLGLFIWLSNPHETEVSINRLVQFADENSNSLIILGISIAFNLCWAGKLLNRFLGLRGQGVKLAYLKAEKPRQGRFFSKGLLVLLPIGLGCALSAYFFLKPIDLPILPFKFTKGNWFVASATTLSVSAFGLWLIICRAVGGFKFRFPSVSQLPPVPQITDGIIIGAVHENDDAELSQPSQEWKPEWLLMGLKGLTGNLLITGVIGSGKSQILLQFLRQILQRFSKRPAMLAIDPKRTFVRELKKIIESQGQFEHLLWISLGGTVKFNPIWREGMLIDSAFVTIANTLKLASINFLGSSGENRFWEQSSFNLLKNSLVFCAAKFEYFTFKELYRALIEARDEGLAAELVDHLNAKQWSVEERANIEMAIDYFKNEFSQMDQKIRTSILATATGFLNEFLEYRISQILSPRKEDITLGSMSEAIQDGKLMLLHIENDALARSVGTLLKLMFQEAVLARVDKPGHDDA